MPRGLNHTEIYTEYLKEKANIQIQAVIVEQWRELYGGVLGKICRLVDQQTCFVGG